MDDLRWFAPNRYCTLPVEALRARGLRVALEGDRPARLAFAADNQTVVAGYEWSRRRRCPLVAYVWDLPPWRLGEGRPDFVFAALGKLRRIRRPAGGYVERAGYYSRIGWVARRARAVFCPSSNTVGDVRARFGVSAELVPFCYDSARFRPAPESAGAPPRDGGPPVLLSVSRLMPYKNHAAVIRAAALMPERPRVRLIGQGPEATRLRLLAAELGVPLDLSDVWVDNAGVLAAYRSADAVVAPSRFEGFGLTPIEALACGTPVAASDIPPHREFLGDRAEFAPLDDDAALAGAIRRALGRGRTPIAEPFPALTVEACAERIAGKVRAILEGAA